MHQSNLYFKLQCMICLDTTGLFGLKDFHRNIGGFQSIGFFPKEALWIKGTTPPKFLWMHSYTSIL